MNETANPDPQKSPPDPAKDHAKVKGNPLVGYLEIFQKQHRRLQVLSRLLLFCFALFMGMVSAILYSAFQEDLLSDWMIGGLVLLDLLLALGILRALHGLKDYGKKSGQSFQQIFEHLEGDIHRLERIKSEHAFISKAHKRIKDKIGAIGGLEDVLPEPEHHQGWDAKRCPICHTKVELLQEECPTCHHFFEDLHPH